MRVILRKKFSTKIKKWYFFHSWNGFFKPITIKKDFCIIIARNSSKLTMAKSYVSSLLNIIDKWFKTIFKPLLYSNKLNLLTIESLGIFL